LFELRIVELRIVEIGIRELGIEGKLGLQKFLIHNSSFLIHLHFLVDIAKRMAPISAQCIQSTRRLIAGCSAPVFKGNSSPGGTPDANEEKGKEKETLGG
jgi:hypothetical protein